MKIPRDVSGEDLAKLLAKLDYQVIRQKGSHLRLSTERNGTHHLTIPAHNPLKIGTLSAILGDVAQHHGMVKEELLIFLWEE